MSNCDCDGCVGPTTRELMASLRETLLVLRERDGLPLTDAQIDERCRNGAAKILGNFEINYVGE